MNLIYGIKDKPKFGQVVLFAIQQLLAIMAATIAVPAVVNSGCGTALTASAAIFGAGMGTFVYLIFTKSASPVFLGSSFAFIGSMMSAFSGAASMAVGYWGLIIGAFMAGSTSSCPRSSSGPPWPSSVCLWRATPWAI